MLTCTSTFYIIKREQVEMIWCYVDSGSADYRSAMQETKALFPDGLCCETNADLTTEQVRVRVIIDLYST